MMALSVLFNMGFIFRIIEVVKWEASMRFADEKRSIEHLLPHATTQSKILFDAESHEKSCYSFACCCSL